MLSIGEQIKKILEEEGKSDAGGAMQVASPQNYEQMPITAEQDKFKIGLIGENQSCALYHP